MKIGSHRQFEYSLRSGRVIVTIDGYFLPSEVDNVLAWLDVLSKQIPQLTGVHPVDKYPEYDPAWDDARKKAWWDGFDKLLTLWKQAESVENISPAGKEKAQ